MSSSYNCVAIHTKQYYVNILIYKVLGIEIERELRVRITD